MRKFILPITIIFVLGGGIAAYFLTQKDHEDGLKLATAGDAAGAVRIWRSLAESGDEKSQQSMGLAYYFGDGTAKDRAIAADYFALSAAQGNSGGQYLLAGMNRNGVGVPVDATEAVRLYSLSAAQGNPDAQNYLGEMLRDGDGVTADPLLALMWFDTAFENRNLDRIKTNATNLRATLTDDQFKLAAQMAETCIQSNYQNCQHP